MGYSSPKKQLDLKEFLCEKGKPKPKWKTGAWAMRSPPTTEETASAPVVTEDEDQPKS